MNGFGDFTQLKRPSPYLIWLIGVGGAGKTTLILEFLRKYNPGVIIPMDQRPGEYAPLAQDGIPVYPVSNDSDDWNDIDLVLAALDRNIPKSNIASLIWDSATPGFDEVNVRATEVAAMDADQRKAITGNSSMDSAFVDKSLWMKKLGSIMKHGRHCIWVSHEFEGRRGGKKVVRTSITEHETEKFTHNVNLKLRVFVGNNGQRGIEIMWARNRPGIDGNIYMDEAGMWAGIWDRILGDYDSAKVIEFWDREHFKDAAEAIALGEEIATEAGVPFSNAEFGAKTKYNELREKVKAMSEEERAGRHPVKIMADTWKDYIRNRIAAATPAQEAEPGAVEPVLDDGFDDNYDPEPIIEAELNGPARASMPPEPEFPEEPEFPDYDYAE